MRTFSANFIAEKNKRADGPAPVNLLTFGFSTPVYLSDRDITPSGGSAHLGLIKSWGFIDSSIQQTPGSGILGSIDIADLQLTIINSTSPRFSDKFTAADPPENVTVSLYQLFTPLAYSNKELIFKGVIYGQPQYDLYTCTLTVQGIFQKYNRKIGEDKIIYADGYPDADPDEYGRMGNICYGDLKNVPCHAIVSGDVNSLVNDITISQASIELSDASYFPSSGVIGIDAEKISYTGNNGTTLTGCTRGYGGTTATTHLSGAAAWEELNTFVFQVACHPVKLIGDIFCDGKRITSVCTKYTGQIGNELTGWEGKAVFTVPARLTRQMAIDLLVADGITINDAISVVDTIAVSDGISISDTIAVSDTINVSTGSHYHGESSAEIYPFMYDTYSNVSGVTNPGAIVDGDMTTQASFASSGSMLLNRTVYQAGSGVITRCRRCLRSGSGSGSVIFDGAGFTLAANTTYRSAWYTPSYTTWAWWNSFTPTISATVSSNVVEAWFELELTTSSAATGVAKTGSASKSGTVSKSGAVTKSGAAAKSGSVTRSGAVTLSGNSIVDVRIGQSITANVQGYQDDSSGTYTGVAHTLIERPDHVFKHIWAVLMAAPLADIDTTTFTAAGVFYTANSYKFAMLIYDPMQAADLLMSLALQCRSRFIVNGAGIARLLVRQLDQASGHAIVKNEIKYDSMSIDRSPTDEIINLFYLNCDLDQTLSKSDPISYQHNIKFTDATSIARYGTREWNGQSDLFCFDAVRDEAMAAHVGAFLLAYHCRARKMPAFGVFLDNMEVESGDIIAVTHPLDAMVGFVVEVQKVIHHIGNSKQIDWLEIVTVDNGT